MSVARAHGVVDHEVEGGVDVGGDIDDPQTRHGQVVVTSPRVHLRHERQDEPATRELSKDRRHRCMHSVVIRQSSDWDLFNTLHKSEAYFNPHHDDDKDNNDDDHDHHHHHYATTTTTATTTAAAAATTTTVTTTAAAATTTTDATIAASATTTATTTVAAAAAAATTTTDSTITTATTKLYL